MTEEKTLTKTEKKIMEYIKNNKGSYKELTSMLYGIEDEWSINALRVHLHRIRKKRIQYNSG